MRTISKPITIGQYVETTTTAVAEEILQIAENKDNQTVTVYVVLKDADGKRLQQEPYCINGSNYTLLMSASPSFAPGKPENEYREVDLWYMVDLIRGN